MRRNDLVLALFLLMAYKANVATAVLSPDDCSQNVDIPQLSFSTSSLSCKVVWPQSNFIVRYDYDETSKILSIVLSANYGTTWFAMGLSRSGNMIGSSAMLAYYMSDGVINQYYLGGYNPNQVVPREGNLTVIPNSAKAQLWNQTLYMGFQLSIDKASAASCKVIYAYGMPGIYPDVETGYLNAPHRDKYSMSFDFTTGTVASLSNTVATVRRSHGAVNIFGWAVLAPIGAFTARYLRQWDRWFSLHIGFQISGFFFAVIGLALGVKLTHDLPTVDWHSHRALGLTVFVLGALQVLGGCARPDKDSKYRRVWGWCHHWMGRLALLLAAVNIVVGIRLAGSGRPWVSGYSIVLVVTLLSFIILESFYWCKWLRHRREQPASRPQEPVFSSYEMM